MKLNQLLRGLEISLLRVDPAAEITGVSYDSRTTTPGEVFVAISGTETDGHCFISQALDICNQIIEGLHS